MGARSAVCITGARHVGATAAGEIVLTLSGPGGCEGTVTLKSGRKIASRWLERGRPRVVTLARQPFVLPEEGCTELSLRLSPQHLALLRRMGAIHAVARVESAESHAAKAVTVHAPARRRAGATVSPGRPSPQPYGRGAGRRTRPGPSAASTRRRGS
jgi:hypothetical protein